MYFLFHVLEATDDWISMNDMGCDLVRPANIFRNWFALFLRKPHSAFAHRHRKHKHNTEPEKQMKHESSFQTEKKVGWNKNTVFLPVVLFNFSMRPIWLHPRQMNRVKYGRTRKNAFRNTDLFQILPVEPFRFIHERKNMIITWTMMTQIGKGSNTTCTGSNMEGCVYTYVSIRPLLVALFYFKWIITRDLLFLLGFVIHFKQLFSHFHVFFFSCVMLVICCSETSQNETHQKVQPNRILSLSKHNSLDFSCYFVRRMCL